MLHNPDDNVKHLIFIQDISVQLHFQEVGNIQYKRRWRHSHDDYYFKHAVRCQTTVSLSCTNCKKVQNIRILRDVHVCCILRIGIQAQAIFFPKSTHVLAREAGPRQFQTWPIFLQFIHSLSQMPFRTSLSETGRLCKKQNVRLVTFSCYAIRKMTYLHNPTLVSTNDYHYVRHNVRQCLIPYIFSFDNEPQILQETPLTSIMCGISTQFKNAEPADSFNEYHRN